MSAAENRRAVLVARNVCRVSDISKCFNCLKVNPVAKLQMLLPSQKKLYVGSSPDASLI